MDFLEEDSISDPLAAIELCESSVPAEGVATTVSSISTETRRPQDWYKHRRRRTKKNRNADLDCNPFEDVPVERFLFLKSGMALADAHYVCRLLNYVPFNLVDVGYYEAEGLPAVLRLYPLNTYEHNNYRGRFGKEDRQYDYQKGTSLFPFPTLFWMLSPRINSQVGALEKDGWIETLVERLNSNPDYINQMESAHRAYGNERWSLLREEDREYVGAKGWLAEVRDSGIAGMQYFTGIKCLHTHYAHYLARPEHGNLVGQWVHELLHPTDASATSA